MARDGTAFGAALILGGMAVLGITDNFVRLISDAAGLWQFHLLRSAMALPMLALAAAALGLALRPRRLGRGGGALGRCRPRRCCSTSARCR